MFRLITNHRTPLSELILKPAREAQLQISAFYERTDVSQIPGTSLEQAGLRDGLEIVEEYLTHSEYGIAFDHLLYMIEEADIALSSDSCRDLIEAANRLQQNPDTLQKITLRRLHGDH